MQKLEKNFEQKQVFKRNPLKLKKKSFNKFKIKPKLKFLKRKRLALNPKFRSLFFIKQKVRYQLSIRIKQNNIFCTFKNIKQRKTILVASSGKLRIKITKKTLRFSNKRIIQKFLNKVKNFSKLFNLILLVDIKAPIKVRKFIIKQFSYLSTTSSLIFSAYENKCFNGCRPKKKKRKKQKRFRLFK